MSDVHRHFPERFEEPAGLEPAEVCTCANGPECDLGPEDPRCICHAEPTHDCLEHAAPYTYEGPLGHGWKCAICNRHLQSG